MDDEPPTLPPELERELDQLAVLTDDQRAARLVALRARYPRHAVEIEVLGRLFGEGVLDDADATRDHPRAVGPYQIVSTIGTGGMGVVYLAQQEAPIRRRVALKLIKLGMDSKAVVARFEQERQALAMMDHDGIARVFDCGTTASGQPFFVMEHVDGLPIDAFCDRHALSLTQRLQLMQQVCAAVEHAHQKGVVHRDLKPSNVLVSGDAARAQVKIIDFGLAKAMGERLVEATLFTQAGQVVGTPEYMAPEQADPGNQDIDTRADVYSLGVILYALLVGELPFGAKQLRHGGMLEVQRILRTVEPPKPSTRLSRVAATASELAATRRMSPTALRAALRNDLDWVVLKALEKERDRRYATALALGEELQRFLDHQPIQAGPPSVGYRVSKFLRRHRVPVVASGLVAAVFLAGVAGTVVGLLDAERGWNAAQSNLERFELLAGVEKLAAVEARVEQLAPPWPSRVEAMRSWRDVEAAEVLALEPRLDAALAELRSGAERLPPGATAKDLLAERARLSAERAALRAALDIRDDKLPAMPPEEIQEIIRRGNASTLAMMAGELVAPDRKVFGRELEGLAMANAAVVKNGSWTPQLVLTFGEAAVATGFDAQAEQALARFDGVPAAQLREWQPRIHALRERILGSDTLREARIAGIDRRAAELDASIADRAGFRFEDASRQFLHDTLDRLRRHLSEFRHGRYREVEDRLHWAEAIARIEGEHGEAWRRARAAIASNPRYAEHPIELSPQHGLVPIGENPATGLWEFYHLASAAEWDESDPARIEIPRHVEDGNIAVSETTGIVFVLVPGGRFQMGAQHDPGPNCDRFAQVGGPGGNESPVHEVTLQPFFLARHEVTIAQWRRLTRGETPSWSRVGWVYPGNESPVDERFPVDSVRWPQCDRLTRWFGLTLPTEAQWEYACRAGTETPWWFGATPDGAAGKLNVHDETAHLLHPDRHVDLPAPWNDNYATAAPVGSYAANAWGMHDMLGNVGEWVRDELCFYPRRPRSGDGERTDRTSEMVLRLRRGGSFRDGLETARCSMRDPVLPETFDTAVGVRFAREIETRD